MRITQAGISLTKGAGEKDSRFGVEECDRRTIRLARLAMRSARVSGGLVRPTSGKRGSNHADRNFQAGKSTTLRDGL